MKDRQPRIKLKTVFFGASDFSIPALRSLYHKYNISAVISQPSAVQGRGRMVKKNVVTLTAENLGLPVYTPSKSDELTSIINNIKPEIGILVAYGRIISADILKNIKYGIINIHPSLLPLYRGPSPIPAAIINGDRNTGTTIMKLDNLVDHGPIIAQEKMRIDKMDTSGTLGKKLANQSARLIYKTIPEYINANIEPVVQNESDAVYTLKLAKKLANLNCYQPADRLLRIIKAYNPWPIARLKWKDKYILIYHAQLSSKSIQPGTIEINKKQNEVLLGTKRNALSLLNMQLPGKKIITAREFINGYDFG